MTDYPSANDLPENNPYILAIEHAVKLALHKAMRRVTVALAVAGCIMIALGGVAWQAHITASRTQATASQLKADSIANCNNNNAFRKSSAQVLDHILTATLKHGATPAAVAFVKNQETYIAKKYAPKNCQSIYSNVVGSGTYSSGATGYSAPARLTSAFHEDAILQGWGGDCLSFKGTPAAGDALNYVACSSARYWQYYPVSGQLRPNADLNLAAGDVNGHAKLVSASDTADSTLNVKDFTAGVHGWEFSVFYFAGHINSDMYVAAPGQVVSLNANTGDGALWVLLTPASPDSRGSA